MGIKYFNKSIMVKESVNPLHKPKYGKLKPRDKSEWLPVKIPAIVSEKLFDKVQERFKQNKESYKRPNQSQLLSNLVKCGICNWSYSPYRRFYRGYKHKDGKVLKRYGVYEKTAYTCSKKIKQKSCSRKDNTERCSNSEIIAHRLEASVLSLVKEIMTDDTKLKKYLFGFSNRTSKSVAKLRIEKQLKGLDQKLSEIAKSEKVLLDSYVRGNISRDEYALRSRNCDQEINKTKTRRMELMKQIPALHEGDVLERSIKYYCESVRTELEEATDFYSQREFIIKYISQIIFTNGNIELVGFIPIQLKTYNDSDQSSELSKVEFRIQDKVRLGMKKEEKLPT